MTCGVYLVQNKINGKKYFGQSIDIERRLYEHRCNKNHNIHLTKAINKYGIDNFNFDLYIACKPEYLNRIEKLLIRVNDTVNPKKGYNKDSGGTSAYQFSEEVIKKLSELNKGKIPWNKGKKHSEKTKHKISIANSGKNNGFFNKHHTEKTLKKISGKNSTHYRFDIPDSKELYDSWKKGSSFRKLAKLYNCSHTAIQKRINNYKKSKRW